MRPLQRSSAILESMTTVMIPDDMFISLDDMPQWAAEHLLESIEANERDFNSLDHPMEFIASHGDPFEICASIEEALGAPLASCRYSTTNPER